MHASLQLRPDDAPFLNQGKPAVATYTWVKHGVPFRLTTEELGPRRP
jgi:hypothetical protein